MTRLPNDQQIRSMFETLRRLSRPLAPKGPTGFDVQERRILALAQRARTPAPEVDGYPSSVMNDGPRGNAELTSVEAAANRAFPDDQGMPPRVERDWIAEDAENAIGYLVDAVNAIGAMGARLDHADRISNPLSRAEAGGAGACGACGADVSGAANDRLRSGYCQACNVAWKRAGSPDRATFKRERSQQQVAG
jgi:hypothetical protein